MILTLRLAAIAIGIALFAYAELRDAANERKAYSTGRDRNATFNADAIVFGLRITGTLFVVVALLSWVIGHGGAIF